MKNFISNFNRIPREYVKNIRRRMKNMTDKNTQADELVGLIAMSGEFPTDAVYRLGGSGQYKEKLITHLKKSGVIKTHYKDKLRGYRLTTKTKQTLLTDNPDRFRFYFTGDVDTNIIQSSITRRLRLHRIANVIVTMHNADIKLLRDDKPDVFNSENSDFIEMTYPSFYSSREFKELNHEMVKVKNARAVGILLTDKEIYIVYNTENYSMKWDYKSEMSVKAIIRQYLCQSRMPNQYPSLQVKGLLFGNGMEMLYQTFTGGDNPKRNRFFIDGPFDRFIYLTNDKYGEILLKLLCDNSKKGELDCILMENLHPPNRMLLVENDAIDDCGNPVLFAYLIDMPRLTRFNTSLSLQKQSGIIICFDFQKKILSEYCGERVTFDTIDFTKFKETFYP